MAGVTSSSDSAAPSSRASSERLTLGSIRVALATGSSLAPALLASLAAELRQIPFVDDAIATLRRADKIRYKSGATLDEALIERRALAASHGELQRLVDFIAGSQRGLIR